MKRNIIISIFFSLLFFPIIGFNNIKADSRVIERVYVATDRNVYVAGEVIWLSAYCFDLSGNKNDFSPLSSIAYIEIHNSQGVAITGKIGLVAGRGSGHITIPPSIPTGNYRLISYTQQMRNEEKVVYFDKVITIYNTLSSSRVLGNIEVSDTLEVSDVNDQEVASNQGNNSLSISFNDNSKSVKRNSKIPITLSNIGKGDVSFSISIIKDDSIKAPAVGTLKDYLQKYRGNIGDVKFVGGFTPEYEGEIIRGRVNEKEKGSNFQNTAYLSASNGVSDIYTSPVDSNGRINFFTNSIYGERDIVLEIRDADSSSQISFELFDPFLKPQVDSIPKLVLSKKSEKALIQRSIAMQIGRRFGLDTLYEKIPHKNDPLYRIAPIVYNLDDYTRFPDMQEVVVEFISELRFRKIDGKADLQVRWENGFNTLTYSRNNTLVLLDGIPVFDHNRILKYDPLKVKSISIYGREYYIGFASIDGIVSLKTYKGDHPGLTFNKNVRILEYQGVLYPCKFTAKKIVNQKTLPDLRTTLFWDPNITLAQNESLTIDCYTSENSGKFVVLLEGTDSNGLPIYLKSSFIVK